MHSFKHQWHLGTVDLFACGFAVCCFIPICCVRSPHQLTEGRKKKHIFHSLFTRLESDKIVIMAKWTYNMCCDFGMYDIFVIWTVLPLQEMQGIPSTPHSRNGEERWVENSDVKPPSELFQIKAMQQSFDSPFLFKDVDQLVVYYQTAIFLWLSPFYQCTSYGVFETHVVFVFPF